ncbi:MAG: apolipoprotein N-acyltransferase [Burkholderiales bacterium]
MTRRRAELVLGAFALGLLNAASYAPWSHWTVSLLALTGLFWLMHLARSRGAVYLMQAVLAFAFGMGWLGAGLSWLFISMHFYGGMPAPLAVMALVLFAAYLSVYPMLASAIAWRWCADRGLMRLALGTAGAWTLAELARGWVFTGFPWLALGYAQIDGPLTGLAPVAGVFALGGVSIGVASLCAGAIASIGRHRALPGSRPIRSDPTRPELTLADRTPTERTTTERTWQDALRAAATALGLLLAPLALPASDAWTSPSGPALSVRLLQGNVPQDMKFRPERTLAAMQTYVGLIEAGDAALTILPETAWTIPFERTPPELAQRLDAHVGAGRAVAIGLPALHLETGRGLRDDWRLSNSVLLLEPGGAADRYATAPRYDKQHLVPFGEFIPWGFAWFVNLMQIPMGDFGRGAPIQAAFAVGGQRVAFNICYEDLFGEEIRAVLLSEQGASILANVSNIAWFGRSHALPQHLQIARMRSLETGRPMLRSTNTGTTAAIDAAGKVTAQLEPYTTGALDVSVQGTSGLTPFTRLGNAPILLLALICLALALFAPWRSDSSSA